MNTKSRSSFAKEYRNGKVIFDGVANIDKTSKCVIILGHGFGSDIDQDLLQYLLKTLPTLDIGVFLIRFPFRKNGKFGYKHNELVETFDAAVKTVRQTFTLGQIYVGGVSLGGRAAIDYANLDNATVGGVVSISYPLTTLKGKRSARKENTLINAVKPFLLITGSNDSICPRQQLEGICRKASATFEILNLDQRDHMLKIGKESSISDDTMRICSKGIENWINTRLAF